MKYIAKIICICFILTCGKATSQEIATVQQLEIQSKILNQSRPVLVYTPQSYNEWDLVSYDVIYVFDS